MVSPLNIMVCSDGRPGHEKQTLSVVAALKTLTPIRMETRRLIQTSGIRRVFQGLGSFLKPDKPAMDKNGSGIDLIIGAGSTTHLPMVAMKLRSDARLVICMAPEPLLRPFFDLCLVPRHDNPPRRGNIFTTFGPPCLAAGRAAHDAKKGLILAGGLDPKSHYWDTPTLLAQIRELSARQPAMTWTVSSSPRTPADAIAQLQDLAGKNSDFSFFNADDTPAGWIETAYREHGQVWVTADSVSMVYEALTAGCRVGILPVAWKHPGNKFQRGIDDLVEHALVVDFFQWQNGASWPPMTAPLNEAERCALEILQRWWPERLP